MLEKTQSIYQESTNPQDELPRHLSGQFLARNRLSARHRARLAASIIDGRATIDVPTLTVGQIAKLCRTNRVYLNEERFPERVKHARRIKLAKAFNKIDFDSRAELCRVIGVERVWAALAAAID
jgi:hypothetical protein